MVSGRFAVVEGCPDMPEIELTLSSMMESLHIRPTEEFQVHGTCIFLIFLISWLIDNVDSLLRESHHTEPQISMTIAEFIDNLKNPNAIQAILDSPYGTGQHPRLIG